MLLISDLLQLFLKQGGLIIAKFVVKAYIRNIFIQNNLFKYPYALFIAYHS